MAAFWTTSPAWLKFLFRLRDLLVRPFGLKTGEGPSREKLEEALNNGESCGFMSVAERTADETIVALDDKHLVAYMSIYIEGGEVFASTVVKYHNKLGVVYFNLIRPFHILVVKNLFKQMMREHGFRYGVIPASPVNTAGHETECPITRNTAIPVAGRPRK